MKGDLRCPRGRHPTGERCDSVGATWPAGPIHGIVDPHLLRLAFEPGRHVAGTPPHLAARWNARVPEAPRVDDRRPIRNEAQRMQVLQHDRIGHGVLPPGAVPTNRPKGRVIGQQHPRGDESRSEDAAGRREADASVDADVLQQGFLDEVLGALVRYP